MAVSRVLYRNGCNQRIAIVRIFLLGGLNLRGLRTAGLIQVTLSPGGVSVLIVLLLHFLLQVAEMANRIVVNQQDALLSEGFSADLTLVWSAGIVVLVGLTGARTSLEIISLLSVFFCFV